MTPYVQSFPITLLIESCLFFASLPVRVVDAWAVKQGGDQELLGTHTLQHQADSIQGGEEEEEQGEQEAAVVGLSHAVVYPVKHTQHRSVGRT